MKNCSSVKASLLIGTIILLISSIIAPMAIGYFVDNSDKIMITDNYDCYHISEIPDFIQYPISKESDTYNNIEPEKISKPEESRQSLDGPPMDSPWPMYCHDIRHTGRSPFSTVNNLGTEKWKFWTELSGISGGIVISEDGTIYFGGSYDFYSVNHNGTLKWRYNTGGVIMSCPAIDENGVIYIGSTYDMSNGDYLYALYPNGTLKWKYPTGQIFSSPVIDKDGTIFVGSRHLNPDFGTIYALYPNGTLKWKYNTPHVILSSPAIGSDSTIYCGCHDTNLYALFPNNGTLKWKYKTGNWIRTSPCIADDDTIYVISLDDYLHAVYPNGTMMWKTNVGAGTSPTIGHDGTIYCGYTKLHAVNPVNGTIKWKFDVGGKIRGATPCNSIDGTIYLGNYDGSEIVAVNPNGTEKWRVSIGGDVESAPAIGEDGTVYIGSQLTNDGYLHAFGTLDSEAPSAPDIDGPKCGKPGIEYNFTFVSTDPDNQSIKYYVDWGDRNTIETDYHESGEVVTLNHTWNARKTYTIKAIAEDFYGEQSNESSFKITIPRNKVVNFSFNRLSWFLERFPMLERLFSLF